MTSLLEGALRAKIAAGFKGKLTLGTLRRATSTALNDKGDETSITTKDIAFEGIREDFSAAYKATAGIPDTDVKILILLGSLSDQTITPRQDDKIFMKTPWNKWYQCRKVLTIDPAAASCSLQAYEIPTP